MSGTLSGGSGFHQQVSLFLEPRARLTEKELLQVSVVWKLGEKLLFWAPFTPCGCSWPWATWSLSCPRGSHVLSSLRCWGLLSTMSFLLLNDEWACRTPVFLFGVFHLSACCGPRPSLPCVEMDLLDQVVEGGTAIPRAHARLVFPSSNRYASVRFSPILCPGSTFYFFCFPLT